jgi:hypothetical protein
MRLITAIPNLFTPSKTDISFEKYTLSKEMVPLAERPITRMQSNPLITRPLRRSTIILCAADLLICGMIGPSAVRCPDICASEPERKRTGQSISQSISRSVSQSVDRSISRLVTLSFQSDNRLCGATHGRALCRAPPHAHGRRRAAAVASELIAYAKYIGSPFFQPNTSAWTIDQAADRQEGGERDSRQHDTTRAQHTAQSTAQSRAERSRWGWRCASGGLLMIGMDIHKAKGTNAHTNAKHSLQTDEQHTSTRARSLDRYQTGSRSQSH